MSDSLLNLVRYKPFRSGFLRGLHLMNLLPVEDFQQ